MKVTQMATVLNTVINKLQIGQNAVVTEDLSNIVDIGKEILDFTATNKDNYDSFVGSLIDHVGKVMFDDKVYTSQAPNIIKDKWEYASIMEKVRCELPDARDNDAWSLGEYPLDDGTAYPDPFELAPPELSAKFYNGKTTFEVPITIPQYQLNSAFSSASEVSRLIGMIENRIRLKMTLSTDGLIMRTIVSLIAQKIGSNHNVVNLLTLYNAETGSALTATQARHNEGFMRFASKTIALYGKYIQEASMLYNNAGYVTFTPKDRRKVVMISDFAKSLETYLYSNTFHEEFVKLEGFEEVGQWQGSGTANGDREKINAQVLIGGTLTKVEQNGVVAVMFDEYGAMVCNENYRVTSIYNPRGEYTNYFYKCDAHYMNDINENCIVFVIA